MNNKLKYSVFLSIFSATVSTYALPNKGEVPSFFDKLFNIQKAKPSENGVMPYYKNLKLRIFDIKNKATTLSLFSKELSEHPEQSSNIFKAFIGTYPQYSKQLMSNFLNHANFNEFIKIETLSKKVFTEVVERLSPIKALMLINIRDIFSIRLTVLLEKYPQYSVQLLTYANELKVISNKVIVDNNHIVVAKTQANLLKIEDGSRYDMAIGGALALVAMSGGGSGGGSSLSQTCGGGPCSPTSEADSYKTTEFNSQAGLAMVKAETLYSYGGSGSDVKVSVFDTGILASHSEFSGRVLSSDGYDYVNNVSGVTADDNGHGTHVSGIIAANKGGASGMHGVAYNAKIIPYKIGNSAGSIVTTDVQLADAYSRATAKGSRIFNNSWGSSATIKAATHKTTSANSAYYSKATLDANIPSTLSQIQSSINSDVIFVWAAGNSYFTEGSYQSGLPYYYPDMKKGYLSVMSLNTDGTESVFLIDVVWSADWCIAAPGRSIYSTYNDGAYKALSGTSMAAPMVSGALAGLKSRFPSLSYHQVRDRLLTTANSTGIYADSTIFGKGLMDLSAASSPVGVTMITTTMSDDGMVISSVSSIATLSSEVFAVFADQIANNKIMLVDSFDRANFYTDASAFVKSKKRAFNVDLESLFDQQNMVNKQGVSYYKSNNGQIGLSGVVGLNSDLPTMYWFAGDNSEKALNKVLGLSDSISVAKNTSTGLSLQIVPEGKLGVWTNISSKASDDGLIPLAIQNSITVASLNTGLSLTKDFSINNSLITAGIAYGKPDALSNSLSASGAFKVEAKDAFVSFASIGSKLGQVGFDLTAQNTQINSTNDLSLFKVPDNISLNDVNAKFSFASSDQKSQISLSLGKTKTQGSSVSTLSIPISVDESGSVSYLDMSTPTGALFDHTRMTLSAKTKVNDDLDLVGVISSYNPTLNKAANEQVIGVASRWKF